MFAAAQIDTTAAFRPPLTITKGGHYTGNYKSTNAQVAAITISCTDTVWLTDVFAISQGDAVHANGGAILIINNLRCNSLPPADNQQRGWGFYAYKPTLLRLQHFVLESTGGLRIDQRGNKESRLQIRYGTIKNTSRLTGANGIGKTISPGLQLVNLPRLTASEIGWIYFENEPDKSYVEDNINLYNSGGKSSSDKLLVHDIFVNGAYPFPADAARYSGTGITTDGDAKTRDAVSAYIDVFHCQFIRTLNAAMNLPIGHDVHYFNNTVVNSGHLKSGKALPAAWSATCMWNMAHLPDSVFYNNSIDHNTIGYFHAGTNAPFANRQDENATAVNLMKKKGNTYLPNPITFAMEEAELKKWKAKLKAANIVAGVTYKK